MIDGATNYAIYMLDPAGRVASWNRGAERIKGWSEAEVVGQDARIFYVPEDVAAGVPAQELARAETCGRLEQESWRVRKDGSRFLADVTITALRAPSGELRGFGKVVRDITDERAAQEALARREGELAAILATVPDAMVVLDAGFRILSFSCTGELMFGHVEADLVGRDWAELLTVEHRHAITPAATLPLSGRRLVGLRRDGTTFPVELALDRIGGSAAASFIAFLRDLSDRERTLQELKQLEEKLVQVGRVSLLGMMGTTLAHELNQPVAALVNYAEALRDTLAARGPAALVEEAIDGVVAEALRAGAIVRQLRGFIERGDTDKQRCDLAPLIRQSCDLVRDLLTRHGIALRLDLDHGDQLVFAEPIQVQQVVLNLVRNAVEAMASVERRALVIATHRKGTMVEVEVCDTGHGIAPAVAATLFSPFTSDKASGLGVGLSICRTIVEAHGGTIAAVSRDDATCIAFTLPIIDDRASA